MHKIKKYFLRFINRIWKFLTCLWEKITSFITGKRLIKEVKEKKESEVERGMGEKSSKKGSKSNQLNQENKFELEINGFKLDEVSGIDRYYPEQVEKKKNILLDNYNFAEGFSGWNKKERGLGKVKIIKNHLHVLNGNSALMLSVPENSPGSLAMIEQKLNLKPHSCYNILLTAKSDRVTSFPLFYVTIDSNVYKIKLNPKYRSFKITFKNGNKKECKLTLNTGFKLSKAPTIFYIDNILLYEIQVFTVDE